MNEITCAMCQDLLPLVKDGIASDDSRDAVLRHIETCDVCRSLYDGALLQTANGEKAFQKLKRKIQLFSAMVLMFGIFFGIGLTDGSGLFYNSLLMPLIGALGYGLFRWRALYQIPVMLFVVHIITNCFGLIQGAEQLNLYSLVMWTGIYALFAILGVIAAGLFHFALRKERK